MSSSPRTLRTAAAALSLSAALVACGSETDPNRYDIYQNYELAADRRDDLRVFLKERGIGSIMQWAGTPVHKFAKLGFNTSIPGVDKFFERCLMLPMNMTLSDEDVQFIIKSVKDFYAQ